MYYKVKKPLAVLASLLLVLAFVFSGAFTAVRLTASAAAPDELALVNTNVTNYVIYGKTFTVGKAGSYKVSVEAPDGSLVLDKQVLAADEDITAAQVGIYVVTYYADENNDFAVYSYNVESYMEYEYYLIVDGYGAGLPSVWKSSNTAPTLPGAKLYYYDEDEEKYLPSGLKDDPGRLSTVNCKVTAPDGTTVTYSAAELASGKKLYATGAQGVYYVTYYAELYGGRKILSEQFTVQVQNTFNDAKAPTMSISGVSSTSSVNVKNTLPKATLTDDYDERVNVTIKVTHAFGEGAAETDVPDVVIDKKTGFAAKDDSGKILYYEANADGSYKVDANGDYVYTTNIANAVKAVFDNDKFMDFIPTEEGIYKVSYAAMDNTGKVLDSDANKTKEQSFTIKVSDTTAPVIDKLEDSLIPTRWGMSSVKRLDYDDSNGNGQFDDAIEIDSKAIRFPIPEAFDNATATENIKCAFTLTDNNSKQILSFENILATSASDSSKSSTGKLRGEPETSYYFFKYWEGTGYTVNPTTGAITGPGITGNAISLVYYDPANGSKGFFDFDFLADRTDYLGTYTVTYRLKDDKGTSSSRSFELILQDSYRDTDLPSVDFTAPKYIAFRNYESIETITNVTATDANDTRLAVEYYILFNNTIAMDGTFDAFEEAAVLGYGDDIVELDSMLGYNDIRLKIDNGEYIATIEDAYGDEHKISVDVTKSAYLAIRAIDSVGNFKFFVEEIQIIDGTVAATYDVTPVYTYVGETPAVTDANGYYTFGSFYIDFGSFENRNYTGFELYVKQVYDKNGRAVDKAPLSTVSFETYSDNRPGGTHRLYVDNIRFKVSASGKYMIVTRGFNVSGDSATLVSFVDIDIYTGAGSVIVSSILSDELNYGETYSLPNDYYYSGAAEAGVLRAITGGRMQLMGTEFTALQCCSFSFVDYVFEYSTTGNIAQYDANYNVLNVYAKSGSYSSRVDDKEKPVFQTLGVMPTYAAKNDVVRLPAVSASSANGKSTAITCKVTDKDGNAVEVIDSSRDNTLGPNEFSFRATKDGNYTVSYTAIINDNESSTSYTIACGDITPPEFTVDIGYINSSLKRSADGTPEATVNDLFDFAIIQVDDEDSTGYTYSKTLLTPENEEVSDSKVTDNASKNNGTSYELTLAGTYTVVYKVTDNVGNTTTIKYYITVTTSSSNVSSEAIQTLAIVLIIVGVIVIAGAVIYFIRFRKRKS
ncbi:MAG: hypothetical protein J6X75_03400 [Clostridia bacterium]|nr:hypothetical protein [Clostridia bacterium]